MKNRALVGFTWVDAFCWLATEARAQGLSVEVKANTGRMKAGAEIVGVYTIVGPNEGIDPNQFDEIITRQSMEGAA